MAARIKVAGGDATDFATPALVVNLFQGVTQPGGGTGAVDRALGGAISRLIADGEIKGKLARDVGRAGERSGERFWELPMLEDYRELIRSDLADMKNSGGRQAGSITAAMLLREFVEDADWVHLDIAGTSTASNNRGRLVKGATGVPTRTLAQLAMNLANGD